MSLENTVSVIIPVYNASEYLERCVNSALMQPETAEVILIEDGSRDNSIDVCKKLAGSNPKVKLYTHPGGSNKGAGASRNVGLRNARYTYIAFLDADDYFLPDRFKAEREIFLTNPSADGVYGAIGVEYYDKDAEERFKRSNKEDEFTTMNQVVAPEVLIYSLLGLYRHGYFSIDALTVKRSVFDENSLYFNEDLRLHQDTELQIRLAYHTKLFSGSIENAVANRGVHGNNRITSIPNVKAKDHHKFKMYRSLYQWCRRINIRDEKIRTDISLQYYAYLITQRSGLKKWIVWLKNISRDRRLLSIDRYFYIYEDYLLSNRLAKRIGNKLRHIYVKRAK